MQAMGSCCINVFIAIAFLLKFLIWINKLLMVLDRCLVFITWQLFRSSSKTSHLFCWVQVVGDEWPDRLFMLPKWITKNVVNLTQLSKRVEFSIWGKAWCYVLWQYQESYPMVVICCFLTSIHFPFTWECVAFTHFQPYCLYGSGPLPKSRGGSCLA